jgi:DNA-binding transcriptional regulator YhcF (GntR family)
METSALVQRLSDCLHDGGAQTVAQRVVEELWLAVVDGSLESGERLPTARELAIALNVSPRSIERAYDELEQRGVTASRAGAGTFISLRPPSEADLARHQQFARLCRQTLESAAALGFGIDELLDCLAEYRTMGNEVPQPERLS